MVLSDGINEGMLYLLRHAIGIGAAAVLVGVVWRRTGAAGPVRLGLGLTALLLLVILLGLAVMLAELLLGRQ